MRTRIGSGYCFAALALLLLTLALLSCGEGKSGTSGISAPGSSAGRGAVESGAVLDESVYEMLGKREQRNVLNEVLNKHILIHGAELFYRLVDRGRT